MWLIIPLELSYSHTEQAAILLAASPDNWKAQHCCEGPFSYPKDSESQRKSTKDDKRQRKTVKDGKQEGLAVASIAQDVVV